MARLHVFGDSHAIAYEGGERGVEQERRSRFAGVEVHHLGPALAFNLARDDQGTPGKWGLAIEEEISRLGADVAAVLLVFGEIDIRAHCVKHALAQQASVREAAAAIARRHYAFARRLAGLTGVPVFCAGPVASAKDFSHQYPLIGSEVERNYATCVYNELLSDWCADTPGVYFFSAHSRLMTPDLETRSEYFGDGCHLNHRGIDLVIEAFKRTVAANGLDLPDFFRPRQDLLRPEVTLVDIAPRCRVLAVSSSYHKTPVKALWGTPYFFHTDQDDEPHIQLDLGYMASIARLDVYNRTECAKERARFLVVEAGPTLSRLEVVYRHDGTVFGQDGSPLLIENFNGPVRYLRCSLAEKQYFHLSRLRILARTYRGRA